MRPGKNANQKQLIIKAACSLIPPSHDVKWNFCELIHPTYSRIGRSRFCGRPAQKDVLYEIFTLVYKGSKKKEERCT
jgi:hypothetical protein